MIQSINSVHRNRIFINEVAPRDGFQNEAVFINTLDKVDIINNLSKCGFAKIEVTSFTSPKAIPALRDAEAVMQEIIRAPNVTYTALVPNIRGVGRALACDIDEVNLVMSMSETHNRSNLRMTRENSFDQLREVIKELHGTDVKVNVSLSTAMGCPMEGDVPLSTVMEWMYRFAELDKVDGFTLCDTTGMAYPAQVCELCALSVKEFGDRQLTLHFHNTRGMALANTLAALSAGIIRFDSSLGGLGGCPYAPGASGNLCTEELVHMLELDGYDTGVDLTKALSVAACLPELVGHDVPSQILKAGQRLDLHPIPISAKNGLEK